MKFLYQALLLLALSCLAASATTRSRHPTLRYQMLPLSSSYGQGLKKKR